MHKLRLIKWAIAGHGVRYNRHMPGDHYRRRSSTRDLARHTHQRQGRARHACLMGDPQEIKMEVQGELPRECSVRVASPRGGSRGQRVYRAATLMLKFSGMGV